MNVIRMSVEYTNEFFDWWITLTENQQEDVTAMVELLMQYGTNLPFPYSSGVNGARHSHMRELRVQSGGKKFVFSTHSIPDV